LGGFGLVPAPPVTSLGRSAGTRQALRQTPWIRTTSRPHWVLAHQLPKGDSGVCFVVVGSRLIVAFGALTVMVALAGCSSGTASHNASATTAVSPTTAASSTTSPASTAPSVTATTGAVAAGAPTCPTMSQADTALGVSDTGPTQTSTRGGGIVCEYTGAGGSAAVAIFAHQSVAVFAGQVAHAPGAPAMPQLSGVGDGAFGSSSGGRSIVNAYSNASRTLVAAQAPGALAPVEALARVALADN